jgi:hypothetical protein
VVVPVVVVPVVEFNSAVNDAIWACKEAIVVARLEVLVCAFARGAPTITTNVVIASNAEANLFLFIFT